MELSDTERFYDLRNTVEKADAARLQGLKVASNAITIHRDLVTLFRTNQLSVDVGDAREEDRYRIVCIAPPELELIKRPRKHLLVSDDRNDRLNDGYLERHLVRCLLMYTGNGGIEHDYDVDKLRRLLFDNEWRWSTHSDFTSNEWRDNRDAQLIHKWMVEAEKQGPDSFLIIEMPELDLSWDFSTINDSE
ncbi:hypothetical protein DXG03_002053 [Asterophora parasitica]|uniref:Uncharacterized protein n=1 Tax=Asterophora parasitica TaxID=117018 RepID=A0A9P7G8X2_9AGAR|nr:hypothetical protein DXG03_002053 [Asterophora parasitica]